jgi:hypothetical protein
MRIILPIALLVLVACNSAEKKAEPNMAGAYKMLSQNYKNDKTDTTISSPHQLKIYTPDFMMYADVTIVDSTGGFGVGSYTASADTVTENIMYGAGDSSMNDTPTTYKLAIEKTPKGYKQVIADIGTDHYKLTEEYESAGTEARSPLDGLWKLTKAIRIVGKDTMSDNITAYKIYYAGHVIWGHHYVDSLKKGHSGVGYGTFTMDGSTKLKESMQTSTYSVVTGKSFDIDVSMNGNDEFTQTLVETDGTKGIETYQRVKK